MRVAPMPVTLEADGNAATDGQKIYVNPQWMAGVEASAGEGGVRFVMAHELGHANQGMGGGHAAELNADRFAARSIARQGYDFDVVQQTMSRLNQTSTKTHPGAGQRLTNAKKEYHSEQKIEHESFMHVTRKRRTRTKIPVTRRADRNKLQRENAL